MKRKQPEATAFPPGSLIWIKCKDQDSCDKMTKAIEESEMENFFFLITGPIAELTSVDPRLLFEAVSTLKSMAAKANSVLN